MNWLTAVSVNYQKGQDRDNVVGTKKEEEMGDGEFPLLFFWCW